MKLSKIDEEFNILSLRMQQLNKELRTLEERRHQIKDEQTNIIANWQLIIRKGEND